jgi:hypothetical protein
MYLKLFFINPLDLTNKNIIFYKFQKKYGMVLFGTVWCESRAKNSGLQNSYKNMASKSIPNIPN